MEFEREVEFRRSVAANKGRVMVIIHPFYDTTLPGYSHYVDAMKKFIASVKRPVVIFEEYHKKESTRKTVGEKPFIIETALAGSDPLHGWTKLHKFFSEAGVKNVFVGGMYLGENKEWVSQGMLKSLSENPGQVLESQKHVQTLCVGSAFNEFVSKGYPKVRLIRSLTRSPRR